MSERFKVHLSNDLEIRGFSRDSSSEQFKPTSLNNVNGTPSNMLATKTLNSRSFFGSMFFENDNIKNYDSGDESTLTGGSQNSSPSISSYDDETITNGCGASNYFWSAANSLTTGNTTERSSLFSWGDDELDQQTSQVVSEMFYQIEQMLFGGKTVGMSPSLQKECKLWMKSFPHLRLSGSQVISSKEEGFQHITRSNEISDTEHTDSFQSINNLDEINSAYASETLNISGKQIVLSPLKDQCLQNDEEILMKDGLVEELIAYNVTEMEDEGRRYHVPHRKKQGFPPVTPVRCARDTVFQQLFDVIWSNVITKLTSTPVSDKDVTSLLQRLTSCLRKSQAANNGDSVQHSPKDDVSDDVISVASKQFFEKSDVDGFIANDNNFDMGDIPPLNSFLLTKFDTNPPHRSANQNIQPPDFLMRAPTAPSNSHSTGNGSFMTSLYNGDEGQERQQLHDLMTISQKKLQIRNIQPNEKPMFADNNDEGSRMMNLPSSSVQLLRDLNSSDPTRSYATKRPSTVNSQHFLSNQHNGLTGSRLLTPSGGHRRALLSPNGLRSLKHTTNEQFTFAKRRQRSAGGVVRTLKSASGGIGGGGGGKMRDDGWVINNRLPPINHHLQSLHENSTLDFQTANLSIDQQRRIVGNNVFTRISSALADDGKVVHKINKNFTANYSRPNTTHSFRHADKQRVPSGHHHHHNALLLPPTSSNHVMTSSNFSKRLQGLKHSYCHKVFNQEKSAVLSGITGKGIYPLNLANHSATDHLTVDDAKLSHQHNSWGRSSNI